MGKADKVTNIRIWTSTKKILDRERQSPRESYNDIIIRLLKEYSTKGIFNLLPKNLSKEDRKRFENDPIAYLDYLSKALAETSKTAETALNAIRKSTKEYDIIKKKHKKE